MTGRRKTSGRSVGLLAALAAAGLVGLSCLFAFLLSRQGAPSSGPVVPTSTPRPAPVAGPAAAPAAKPQVSGGISQQGSVSQKGTLPPAASAPPASGASSRTVEAEPFEMAPSEVPGGGYIIDLKDQFQVETKVKGNVAKSGSATAVR